MEMVERRIDRVKKALKGDKGFQAELNLLERVYAALCDGTPARALEYDEAEEKLLRNVALLTVKPVIYAANMDCLLYTSVPARYQTFSSRTVHKDSFQPPH